MSKYASTNSWTARRQHELEQLFQENKETIKADLDDLDNSIAFLADKWGITGRMMGRWAERLGWDTSERVRRQNRSKPANLSYKKKPADTAPQAHKLVGLW